MMDAMMQQDQKVKNLLIFLVTKLGLLHYHEDEVYYEEPDLFGGVEGVDYLIAYGGNDEETET